VFNSTEHRRYEVGHINKIVLDLQDDNRGREKRRSDL